MLPINNLDEAQLRHEMRTMYRTQGVATSLRALYEIVLAGSILAQIIMEEQKNAHV